jgi:hypothetical protein
VSDPGYRMSHAEFVLAYENGSVGCSVSVLVTLRLFLAGRIREKRVSIHLRLWAVGLAGLVAASVIGLLKFPVLWVVLGTIAALAIYTLAFFYSIGGVVLSTALANEEFYRLATAERALWIYSDDEENLPKLHKVASMRRARRTQR